MPDIHILKLPDRTGRLEVLEEPSRIFIKLTFNKYGAFDDFENVDRWLFPILERYDSDPRPFIMENPTTGEVATIYGDSSNHLAIIRPPSTRLS